MLQLEFDKEYDDFVKSKEKVFNQNSNGMILFLSFMKTTRTILSIISF